MKTPKPKCPKCDNNHPVGIECPVAMGLESMLVGKPKPIIGNNAGLTMIAGIPGNINIGIGSDAKLVMKESTGTEKKSEQEAGDWECGWDKEYKTLLDEFGMFGVQKTMKEFIRKLLSKEREKKCCGKCNEYNMEGGNMCERYLICDNNCSCGMKQPQEAGEWVDDFDSVFGRSKKMTPKLFPFAPELKSFIHTLLKSEREKAIRECVAVVKSSYPHPIDTCVVCKRYGDAVRTIIKKLQELLGKKKCIHTTTEK